MSSASSVCRHINLAVKSLVSSEQHPLQVTPGANFVLSYILQLISYCMCKSLMQVMTPEGLIKFHERIPPSYLHMYLYDQDHFNLKSVIEREINRRELAAFDTGEEW